MKNKIGAISWALLKISTAIFMALIFLALMGVPISPKVITANAIIVAIPLIYSGFTKDID